MRCCEVLETRGHIEDGKIAHWQVRVQIGATRAVSTPGTPVWGRQDRALGLRATHQPGTCHGSATDRAILQTPPPFLDCTPAERVFLSLSRVLAAGVFRIHDFSRHTSCDRKSRSRLW